ncbi:hypothetical protein FQR65_LT19228 [Abscondita terminalis]|nr:hypothetical protein FQR65_LT19228 [Abscondita terminalis]
MSISEKIRQLSCSFVTDEEIAPLEMLDIKNGIGTVLIITQNPYPAELIKKVQKYIIENSPNKIPTLVHAEALTGPASLPYGVQYPSPISLGASFNEKNVYEMADFIRQQMHSNGIRLALAPVGDLARDLRFGRTNETYGLQSKNLKEGVAATGKHFLGYQTSEGGINFHKTIMNPIEMREQYAKPFQAAINLANLSSVMNSYGEVFGLPVIQNKKILIDLLRNELNFKGFVSSDYGSMQQLVDVFKLASDNIEAAKKCLENEDGNIDISVIDKSLERILSIKFDLGLFENPYPNVEKAKESLDRKVTDPKMELATLETITLLKNNGILPIKDKNAKIAIIGPSGNALRMMFSHYTATAVIELVNAFKKKDQVQNDSVFGFKSVTDPIGFDDIEDIHQLDNAIKEIFPKAKTIKEALEEIYTNLKYQKARESDIVILTVGGKNGLGNSQTSGEGVDTIIEGWLPNSYGGEAIAKVISGDYNPGGKTPIDVPRSVGHLPVYHYQNNGSHHDLNRQIIRTNYVDSDSSALRPFGFGMSYSEFKIQNGAIQCDKLGNVTITVEVKNIGKLKGDEVVQLYGSDLFSSMTRPVQELIGFKRDKSFEEALREKTAFLGKYETAAKEILEAVGLNNYSKYYNCFTKLRFVFLDKEKIDIEKLEKIEAVAKVTFTNNELQLAIGGEVTQVKDAIDAYYKNKAKNEFKLSQESNSNSNDAKKMKLLDKFLDMMKNIMVPIMPFFIIGGLFGLVNVILQMTDLIQILTPQSNFTNQNIGLAVMFVIAPIVQLVETSLSLALSVFIEIPYGIGALILGSEVYPQGSGGVLTVFRALGPDVNIASMFAMLAGQFATLLKNGIGVDEKLNENNTVDDEYRIKYLHDHFVAINDAINDGVNVFGYTMWGVFDLVSGGTNEMSKRVEITDVLNTIKPLIDSENTTSESFEVGMSIPGVLDSINNKFYEPGAVYVGDYDIESFFKKFKGFKKFKFESDGHASTIGEFIYGGHENLKNHVHITIGSAVGMGIIINKKLYRGIKFRAGEISKCYASITSEVNEPVALEVGLGAMSFMYSKITNTELMSGEELFEKYEKNDPKIIELFDK